MNKSLFLIYRFSIGKRIKGHFKTRNAIPLHPPSPSHKRLFSRQPMEAVSIIFPEGLHTRFITPMMSVSSHSS